MREGVDWARMLGNVAATTPLAFAVPGATAPSLIARMASGAMAGGATGALQPTSEDKPYWSQVAQNAGTGAGGGAIAPAALGALARIVSPNVNPDVATLMAQGVRPTPGQIMGGATNRWEEGISGIPLIGDFIKSGRARPVGQFNVGAINQVLSPIGEKLESNLGRDAIAEMQTKVGDFYDALTPHLGIPASSPGAAQLNTDLNHLFAMSGFMPPDRSQQFQNIVRGQILDRMSPGGGMTGESWQDAKSEMGKLAAQYLNSTSADERQLGGAFLQTQVAMRNALRLANPAAAAELGKADAAYGQMLRVNNAAARPGADPGIFTPAQLQAATKSMDPSLRKHVFAAGDALMQNYAEAGKSVLGNRVPDSGTPFRSLMALLGGSAVAGMGGGHLGVSPGMAVGGALAGTGAAAMYSPWGQALLAHMMTSRPDIAAPIGAGVRALSPAASAAWGALAPTAGGTLGP